MQPPCRARRVRKNPPHPPCRTAAPTPSMSIRTVYFVSDGTGITAETFGNSILNQFAAKPKHVRRPFIDSPDKAHQVVREINGVFDAEGVKPVVFVTLVDPEV